MIPSRPPIKKASAEMGSQLKDRKEGEFSRTKENGCPADTNDCSGESKPKAFGEDAGYELVTAKSESLQDGEFPKAFANGHAHGAGRDERQREDNNAVQMELINRLMFPHIETKLI